MIIGIDAGCLVVNSEEQKSGLYRLAVNFLKSARELNKKNQYWLFSFAPIEEKLLKDLGDNFKNIVARPKTGWLYFGLSIYLFFNRVDVFLSLSQSLPLLSFCPKTTVFHDLAFEKFPHLYSDRDEKRLRRISRPAARKADLIFAVSSATKKDLVRFYGVDRNKIMVVYEAAGEQFIPQTKKQISLVRKKYHLSGDYFLFVGSLKPTKNLANIVKAFTRQAVANDQLVLVGAGKFKTASRRIKKLGFVKDIDLPALYSGAIGLIAPSVYEGFGLPWLEAMSCRCPVIASNTGSGPEVVGKTDLLVNPDDVDQIAVAIGRLKNKQFREKMAEQSLKQAKKFHWQKFSQTILDRLEAIKSL